jgi:hypothetical protein
MDIQRPTDQELSGMTVNERLFVCGVINNWNDAVRTRDRDEMIAILRSVTMTDKQVAWTVDTVLKNPARYGF